MEINKIEEKIVSIIAKHFNIDKEKINSSCRLVDELGADDIDNIEIIFNIEDYFKIEIHDDHAEFQTVGDIVKYVNQCDLPTPSP